MLEKQLLSWGLKHKDALKRVPLLDGMAHYIYRKLKMRIAERPESKRLAGELGLIDTPEIRLLAGWHVLESSDSETYRWVMKKASLELTPGHHRSQFLVVDFESRFEPGEQMLSVTIPGGGEIASFAVANGRREYVISLPEGFSGRLDFSFDRALAEDRKGKDPRELAITAFGMRLTEAHDAWRARPPQVLTIESTTRCNFRCVMCLKGAGLVENRAEDFPEEWVDQVVSVASQCITVVLHGCGEPMLSPAFWRFLRSLPAGRPVVVFNSNLSLLDDEKINLILAAPIRAINISMDAATPETYRKIRNADFERTVANVRKLITRRNQAGLSFPKVYLNMTLMKMNLDEAPGFIELVARLGADGADLWHLDDDPGHNWVIEREGMRFVYEQQKLKYIPEKSNRVLREALERGKQLGVTVFKDFNRVFFYEETNNAANPASPQCGGSARRSQPRDCPFPWRELFVTTDGCIRLCCFHDLRAPVGSLSKGLDLLDFWNSPAAREIRRQLAADQLPRACREAPCIYAVNRR